MTAEYAFLEYTYNPSRYSDESIGEQFAALGFRMRTSSETNNAQLWTQRNSIILLNRNDNAATDGISGIGFVTPLSSIEHLPVKYDDDLAMYILDNGTPFRSLFVDEDEYAKIRNILQRHKVYDLPAYSKPEFQHISGIVYNQHHRSVMDHYQDIGFKFTKQGETYNTLVSNNNRFSILIDRTSRNNNVPAMIVDTNDVFASTASLLVNNLDLKEYNAKVDNFGALNYKINSYNCLAFGNEESYSIENKVVQALPGLDVIFRQRKQTIHILEHNILSHYERI
jgi:hypothetical protein